MTAVVDRLVSIVGAGSVVADPAETAAWGDDWSAAALVARRSGARRHPACVVMPRDAAEVAEILAWAENTRTPIVPYGGGSSVCRGIETSDEDVVVDLRRLDHMGDVDEKSRLISVGGGVTGPALRDRLEDGDYTLGHEPQSIAISTVGGWIATRACGQLSSAYGGIEDLVAGLEAVLPGGRFVSSSSAPRRSTGPDVMSLMVGSEGALGIVTAATLRVHPRPHARSGRALTFADMAPAVAACRAVAQSELRPEVVRLYDEADTALFTRNLSEAPSGPLLLLSFAGERAEERAAAAVEMTGGSPAAGDLVDHWWAHRNDAVADFRAAMEGEGILGPHAVIDTMEVSGTWTVLRDLYHSMRTALVPLALLAGCHISHVYPDGACLYFTLAAAPSSDAEALDLLDRWWSAGLDACLTAGGVISHHHGIGRLKAGFLPRQADGSFELLRAVKAAIDPHGIMNPGVLGL